MVSNIKNKNHKVLNIILCVLILVSVVLLTAATLDNYPDHHINTDETIGSWGYGFWAVDWDKDLKMDPTVAPSIFGIAVLPFFVIGLASLITLFIVNKGQYNGLLLSYLILYVVFLVGFVVVTTITCPKYGELKNNPLVPIFDTHKIPSDETAPIPFTTFGYALIGVFSLFCLAQFSLLWFSIIKIAHNPKASK